LLSGQKLQRLGNQHASIAPYQVLATTDGHIILAVGNDGQFRDFCEAAGAGLADDPRFATNEARVTHRADLTSALATIMAQRTTSEWVAALERAQVPCGPINTLEQVYADPHVIARGAVQTMTRADGETVRLAANPIRMGATPPDPRLAPPLLGQDTDTVLRALLNVSEDDLARWRRAGAI
jgi:crotonobetainyl-CoA:carnitine CoA-transferase CaiB-like acyl-CoA transferase